MSRIRLIDPRLTAVLLPVALFPAILQAQDVTPRVVHAFRPADVSAANIEVFNTRTGRKVSGAVPLNADAAQCAATAAALARSLNRDTGAESINEYLFATAGLFVFTVTGGCQPTRLDSMPAFARDTLSVIAYASNADRGTHWESDTKRIAVPRGCRYVSHTSRNTTANPREDRGFWRKSVKPTETANGVTELVVRVEAGPRSSTLGPRTWLGVKATMIVECLPKAR